jgi:hypothetical protein
VSIDDQIGVSEPVPTLGPSDGAGFVDGAAQHCASTPRRQDVRRIWLPSYHSSRRIEGCLRARTCPDDSGSHWFDLPKTIHRKHQRSHRIG